MEFIDEVKVLGSRSRDLAEKLTPEEATKTALILPFIRLLGYDIFNQKPASKKTSAWIMPF